MRNFEIEITVPGQQTGGAVLTAYLRKQLQHAKGKKRPAVIVCPGGGYRHLSDREAEPVIMQFAAAGYHGFLLEYSVSPNRFPVALQELAKTIALIRSHSEDWNVDPDQIYVCGFSAAGHLTCSIGTFWNREFVYKPLGLEAEDVKPNGLILCYPVITAGEFAHQGSFLHLLGEDAGEEERMAVSLELKVTKNMPDTFIWHTCEDQSVPLENTLLLAAAMRREGVNFELHIFPHGRHGLALANEETAGETGEYLVPACQSWIPLVKTWLENRR